MHETNVPNIPPSDDAKAVQIFTVVDRNWRFGVDDQGRSYAVASDVAKSLEHRDANTALRLVDDDEKGTQIVRTPGGPQEMLVIYEDGIWELIFRSSKPEAKAIKKRVKEILHSLTSGEAVLVPQQRQELTEIEMARNYVAALEAKQVLNERVAVLEPKAALADRFLGSNETIYLDELAKALKLTRHRLISVLRGKGVLYTNELQYRAGYETWFDETFDWIEALREHRRALKVTREGVKGVYELLLAGDWISEDGPASNPPRRGKGDTTRPPDGRP